MSVLAWFFIAAGIAIPLIFKKPITALINRIRRIDRNGLAASWEISSEPAVKSLLEKEAQFKLQKSDFEAEIRKLNADQITRITEQNERTSAENQKTIERLEREVASLTASNAEKDTEIARMNAEVSRLKAQIAAIPPKRLEAPLFTGFHDIPADKPKSGDPLSGIP